MRVHSPSLIPVLVALALAGCASADLRDYRSAVTTVGARPATWRDLPVASGQIIVNEHATGASLFLSLVAEHFSPYTHVGLIVIEPDGPFVYEAMGRVLPLPWRPPNVAVGGGVRRVKLATFLARGGITAIFEPPPGTDHAALVQFARAQLSEHKPFDAYYDSRDDSKYYCVEFVARALEASGAAPFTAAATTKNRSVRVALDWLGIHTPQMLLAGDLVDGDRRVALLSRRFTESEVARYFELKSEIHRRFTGDQRIGNVVYWKRQNLHMRPAVDRFFEVGIKGDVAPRALADEILGPMGAAGPARVADSGARVEPD